MAEITQEELEERVATLKRFKMLLVQQRSKFQEYLTVLEKQQTSITSENPEKLLAHTELEQQVVKNIANLQKVIVPMSKICAGDNQNQEIAQIQGELADLQKKVLKQNQVNRDLLRVHIDSIKNQLQNMKNPYRNLNKVYSQSPKVATLVEINA